MCLGFDLYGNWAFSDWPVTDQIQRRPWIIAMSWTLLIRPAAKIVQVIYKVVSLNPSILEIIAVCGLFPVGCSLKKEHSFIYFLFSFHLDLTNLPGSNLVCVIHLDSACFRFYSPQQRVDFGIKGLSLNYPNCCGWIWGRILEEKTRLSLGILQMLLCWAWVAG